MEEKIYFISQQLLNEIISGLVAYGKSATEDTVDKLKNLKSHWIDVDQIDMKKSSGWGDPLKSSVWADPL